MNKQKPTICLNMIVKNESQVIERCLETVMPWIDYWVISDTGSTDGTQEIIRDYFARHDIDGLLLENEWRDFAHNRNLALEQALGKTDYILIMDADDMLVTKNGFVPTDLDAGCYRMQLRHGDLNYLNIKLVRGDLPWRWVGVLHECLECGKPYSSEDLLGDCYIKSTREGARSRNPQKYQDDARVLAHAVIDEPDNARYRFYLAQSHRDYGNAEAAIEHYEKRVKMGGWEEEVWYSLLQIALQKEQLGEPEPEVIQAFLTAYERRPQRAESLYHLARYLRERERYALAFVYALAAVNTPMTDDILFVTGSVYRWQARDELAVSAYWLGHYQQCRQLCDSLLSDPALPDNARVRIQENMQYATERLEAMKN